MTLDDALEFIAISAPEEHGTLPTSGRRASMSRSTSKLNRRARA